MASTEIQKLTLRLLSSEGRALLDRMRVNLSRTSKSAHDLSNTIIAADTLAVYGEVEGLDYKAILTKLVKELLECAEEFGRGSTKPWTT